MRRPLFIKILMANIAVIFLFAFSVLTWAYSLYEKSRLDTIKNDLKNQAELVKYIISKNLSRSNIDSVIKSIHTPTRITLIQSDGVVLADNKENVFLMDNHLNRPEIKEALKNGIGWSIRHSVTVGAEMLYVAIPFQRESIGFIRMSLWLTEIGDYNSSFLTALTKITMWTLIASFIIILILSRSIFAPIERLALFSQELPKKRFTIRSSIKRNDEIGELANSLDSMAAEIEHLFTKLDNEKKELDTIINNLREGLLVVNHQLEIQLANNSSRKIFRMEKIQGKKLNEVVFSQQLIDAFNDTLLNEQLQFVELSINNRFYYTSFTNMYIQKSIVCILYDITRQKDLERQKRDFITNVSHELRTPLTSIKGFTETLIYEEENEKKRKHLDIIFRNSERLINLTNDLLSLSRLENKKSDLNKEKTDIIALIEQVLVIFNDKVNEKKRTLTFTYKEKPIFVNLDVYRMEQVIINLVDNAIRYSDVGKVIIDCYREGSNVTLLVSDDGIGIPKKYQSRIFERFFVVNKSRSRESGGTGLGLSLVKHIVNMHDGFIQLKSDVGKGTTFIITLRTGL